MTEAPWTRTLILYVNHSENADPLEMTDGQAGTIAAHLKNWLCSHGLENWNVSFDIEDEG